MNFDLISDIHKHWSPFSTKVDYDYRASYEPMSPILAVLGDVCEFNQLVFMKKFFEILCSKWDYVLYVLGNHEFYSSTLSDETVSKIKKEFVHIKNLVILERDFAVIEDTLFVGCTLWSNMMNDNIDSWMECFSSLSDYQYIRYFDPNRGMRNFSPNDSIECFNRDFRYLREIIEGNYDRKIVALTHHAPSFQSVSEKYKGQFINGGFANDLDDFILKNSHIKVWAHGHTHDEFDYKIGDTRVVCHPLGYRHELYDNSKSYLPKQIVV